VELKRIVVVVVAAAGAETARLIAADLPEAELHGRAGRVDDGQVTFASTAEHLRALFSQGTAIIGVCAAGIVIRALAPLLNDKATEPPVLAVSPDGSAVVPLLGGHQGANRLAVRVAKLLSGHAALTTAGEVALGLSLDDPPAGWRLANRAAVRPVAADLLAGLPVRLRVEAGRADWLAAPGLGTRGTHGILVTHRATLTEDLVLHPPVLALGVGCKRGTAPDELIALARGALAGAGLAAEAVACVGSLALKADEPAVHALAADLGVPARFFTAAELEAEMPRLATPSEEVFRRTGCHGVAEGAALAAAGPAAELVLAKTRSARATCAVALAPDAIDPTRVGRGQGRLTVVGIGPGLAAWRTPEASRAIAEASDVVGYGPYLDLLDGALAGKTRHEGTIGAEEARCRQALDLAAEGRRVVLACSGDAGIYALASLVFELVDRADRADWNRLEIAVAPGISALQAAAARAGAIIGHDFCAISLSDLLTPRRVIECRIKAAAQAGFVIAFYNPASRRRRDLLAAARTTLLAHRPADTPVVVARQLGREGEAVEVTTLAALDTARVDMLTVLLVGTRETRTLHRGARVWAYTPRGYGVK
jgi:cobalt-precorrin 5A hydrolase/precorrin-3B C17-methyltransferase